MTARHGSISNFALKLADLALLLISLGLTIVYRYSPDENPSFVVDYLSERVKVTNAILGFLLILAWYTAFATQRLYVSHRLSTLGDEMKKVGQAVLVSSSVQRLLTVAAAPGSPCGR